MNDFEFTDVRECASEGNFVKAICFTPKKAPIVCILIGILLLIPNHLLSRILGVFFIAMALAVLKFVKDYKVMDIFDKGIIFYGNREASTAVFVSFDEIESWNVNHENGHDTVEIKLKDGRMLVRDTFEADKAYKALYSLAREKDEKYIRALRDREKALSIPDALNNIRNSFRKK